MNYKFLVNTCLLGGLLACLFILFGCAESTSNATVQLPNAQATSIDINKKIEELTQKIAQNPKDTLLYYERSKYYFEKRDTNACLQDISKAISLSPNNEDFCAVKGFYFYNFQQDDSAEFYYGKAVQMGTINAETYFMLGNLFTMKGAYNDATKFYFKAINFKNDSPDYYFARGFAYQKAKNFDFAEADYKSALHLDTNYVKSYAALFDLYFNDKNDGVGALFFNSKILAKDSLHPAGRLNLSYHYYREYKQTTNPAAGKKYLTLALENAAKAVQRDQNYADAYYQRGYILFEIQKYNEAIDDFERVIKLNPKHARAYFMLGSLYEAFDSPAEAKQFYENALRFNPNLQEAKTALLALNKAKS